MPQYEFFTTRKIEFADVDLAGFVHFARFFVFMETAEHEFRRSIGSGVHMQYEGKEIGWPRLSASCDYFKPVHFEDVLQIHAVILKKGRTSMTYSFTFRRDQDLIAQGQLSSICCVMGEGRPVPIPIPSSISSNLEEAPPHLIRQISIQQKRVRKLSGDSAV